MGGRAGAVGERIGPRFQRSEPRRRALRYIRGLLGDAERKNGWQLAEQLGEATPDGVQHLLARAGGDADAVRDDLTAYVAENLGHADGVLVVDETGFVKKGVQSVGVARQYSGTAGRVENCQVGVFLGYATRRGRALLDRELYLPKEWAEDEERREEAGGSGAGPVRHQDRAGPADGRAALDAGVKAAWLTADAVYGSDYGFRSSLEGGAGLRRRGAGRLRGVARL